VLGADSTEIRVRPEDPALHSVASAARSELEKQVEAAGDNGMPAVVRGAFNMHEQLWVALDRMADLAAARSGAP